MAETDPRPGESSCKRLGSLTYIDQLLSTVSSLQSRIPEPQNIRDAIAMISYHSSPDLSEADNGIENDGVFWNTGDPLDIAPVTWTR